MKAAGKTILILLAVAALAGAGLIANGADRLHPSAQAAVSADTADPAKGCATSGGATIRPPASVCKAKGKGCSGGQMSRIAAESRAAMASKMARECDGDCTTCPEPCSKGAQLSKIQKAQKAAEVLAAMRASSATPPAHACKGAAGCDDCTADCPGKKTSATH